MILDVVVILNLSVRAFPAHRIGLPRAGQWWVRFNSDWNGYSPDFSNFPGHDTASEPIPWQGLPCSGQLGLGPYTALILSQ